MNTVLRAMLLRKKIDTKKEALAALREKERLRREFESAQERYETVQLEVPSGSISLKVLDVYKA